MEVLHNSYNMCTRALPDMYTLIPRGPSHLGVHIRQNTRVHVITTRQMRASLSVYFCS